MKDFVKRTIQEFKEILWCFTYLTSSLKKRIIVLLIGFGITEFFLTLYFPFIYRDLINKMLSSDKMPISLLIILISLYISIMFITSLLTYISDVLLSKIEAKLKEKKIKALQHSSMKKIEKHGSAYWAQVVSEDTKKAAQFFNSSNSKALFSFVVVILVIMILLFVAPVASAILASYFIMYIFFYLRPMMSKNKKQVVTFSSYKEVMEEKRRLISLVNDSFSGRREILLSRALSEEKRKFEKYAKPLYDKMHNIWWKEFTNFIFPFQAMDSLCYAAQLGWVIFAVLVRKDISVGTAFLILTYTQIIMSEMEPIEYLLFKVRNTYAPSIAKLRDGIEEDDGIKSGKREVNLNSFTLAFSDISLTYGQVKVLDNFNLHISEKEKVALIGMSGAGKTTVLNLLLGLQKPQQGRVTISNVDVHTIPDDILYSTIGVLSQNSYIFNRSIYENITLGKNVRREEVEEAVKLSGSKEFISKLPKKMETIAGERGNFLSGGERVRIALARLFIMNPKIVVLDEPLEGVDKIMEEKILKSISDFTKDKTTVIVSHRFSILSLADKFVVIKDGKVAEEGDIETLINEKGTLLKEFFKAEKRMMMKFEKNRME